MDKALPTIFDSLLPLLPPSLLPFSPGSFTADKVETLEEDLERAQLMKADLEEIASSHQLRVETLEEQLEASKAETEGMTLGVSARAQRKEGPRVDGMNTHLARLCVPRFTYLVITLDSQAPYI